MYVIVKNEFKLNNGDFFFYRAHTSPRPPFTENLHQKTKLVVWNLNLPLSKDIKIILIYWLYTKINYQRYKAYG